MGTSTVVFHEKTELSKRPERRRVATAGTAASCSRINWSPDQVPAQGGGEWYSLCVAHWMRMANASSRSSPVADHLPLLPHLAEGRDASPSGAIVDSQSVKTTEKGGLVAMMLTKRCAEESGT